MRVATKAALARQREAEARRAAATARSWTNYIQSGYPAAPQPVRVAKPTEHAWRLSQLPLRELAALSAGPGGAYAGTLVRLQRAVGECTPPSALLDPAAGPLDAAFQVLRSLEPRPASAKAAAAAGPSSDLWDALVASTTKAGLNAQQLRSLIAAFRSPQGGADFLNGLANLMPGEQGLPLRSAAAFLASNKDHLYRYASQLFAGQMTARQLWSDHLRTPEGAAAMLDMLSPFLPPDGRRFASVASGYLRNGPVGALYGGLAFLPQDQRMIAEGALDLYSLDLSKLLTKWIGKFLPPEVQALYGLIMQFGAFSELLNFMGLPDMNVLSFLEKAVTGSGSGTGAAGGSGGGAPPLAARVTDLHACPSGSGAVLDPGWKTVVIGGQPSARLTDQTACSGGPDTIVFGEPTVVIGGQLAARLGDPTAKGGKLVKGCPTVLIGKPYAAWMAAAAAAVVSGGGGGSGNAGGGGEAGGEGGEACLRKAAATGAATIRRGEHE